MDVDEEFARTRQPIEDSHEFDEVPTVAGESQEEESTYYYSQPVYGDITHSLA